MMPSTDHEPEPADVTTAAAAVESAAAWLAIWRARIEPDAAARRAASAAVSAIDDALRELHTARARLITETHAADLATDARADALLARARELLDRHGTTLPNGARVVWRDSADPATRAVVTEALGRLPLGRGLTAEQAEEWLTTEQARAAGLTDPGAPEEP